MAGMLAFSVLMNIEFGEIIGDAGGAVRMFLSDTILSMTEEQKSALEEAIDYVSYRRRFTEEQLSQVPMLDRWRVWETARIESNPPGVLDEEQFQNWTSLLLQFRLGMLDVGEDVADEFEEIITGTKLVDESFYDMVMNIVGNSYVPDMVDGIGREFVTLHSIFDSMISKVELLDSAFYYLYDDVVGNSYVPDMVDGVVDGMGTIDDALADTQDEIKDTTSAWANMSQELRQRWVEFQTDLGSLENLRDQTSALPEEIVPPGPSPKDEVEDELTLLESAWDSTLASITNKTANWIVDMYKAFSLGTLTWQDAFMTFADIAGETMRNLFVAISEGFVKSLVDQDSWVRQILLKTTTVVASFLARAYAILLSVFAFLGPAAPVAAGAVLAAGIAGLAKLGVHIGKSIGQKAGLIPTEEEEPPPDDDPGPRRTGGRQISEITGPTRDLLVDLLSPLASLDSLTGIGNRIYDLLDARLTEGGGLAAASVGGGDIVFESGAITVQGTPETAVDDMYEAIAERFANDRRKWGKLGVRYRQ